MINYNPIPILFEIGGIKIYSWGLFIILAFFVISYLLLKKTENIISKEKIYGLIFSVLIGGFIGARLAYVFINFNYFIQNPVLIFEFWRGGMVSYGAIIGALLLALIYIKKLKLNFWKVMDYSAPYLALGFSIGRIGCFLNWCCYGIASSLPWAIKVGSDVARHPTQIYLAIGNFIIFIILFYINNKRDKKIKTKYTFLLFLIFYSISRILVDLLRDVSFISYMFHILIFIISSLLYIYIQKFK